VTTQLSTKLPSTGTLILLAVVCIALAVAFAYLIRRRPALFALLAVGTLPLRVPISTGGRTVNLLIPLYVVTLAGLLARLRGAWPERPRRRTPGSWWRPPTARTVVILLAASVVLYALQMLYAPEMKKAAENLVFFYVPFGLLFWLLRDMRWDRQLLLGCLAVSAAIAAIFVAIGAVEAISQSLLLNPKLQSSNEFQGYFRVNSVFFDPNIFGRFLALVVVVVMAGVLWARERRAVWLGAAVIAWLMVGIVLSFSQSSIAALLLGCAILAAWRWGVARAVAVAVAGAVIVLAVIVLAPASFHFGLKGPSGSTATATSGRSSLVSGGLHLFRERPLLGFGSGSFEAEYRSLQGSNRPNIQTATSASHTTPITIAAEQGLIGLVVYAALLLAAALVLFRGAGGSVARMAIAAAFAALVLHTWTYADFLEDPFTWALLAVGCALAQDAADSV
jgi:O-antigen ligase